MAASGAGEGVEVVVVGSGTASLGAAVESEMREQVGPDVMARVPHFRVVVDAGLASYAAFGLARGVRATCKFTRCANCLDFFKFFYLCCCRGRVPCRSGDPWQQGGIFLVAPGTGAFEFTLREAHPGYPLLNPDELAAVLAPRGAGKEAPAPEAEVPLSVDA